MNKVVRVAMVAGEASGDLIGAHIIEALKQRLPHIEFFGIGGPKMVEQGFQAWWPQEKLAVNGLVEVLKHFVAIFNIQRLLKRRLLKHPPDLFIGIDSPDFNLGVETKLKAIGVPVIHYVSPTVWAWRKNRIKKITQSVSHMLVLFPFELAIYRQANIPATYVGHPLADLLPVEDRRNLVRRKLGIPFDQPVFALLPGSRMSEIKHMGGLFIDTARRIYKEVPNALFIVPFINSRTEALFNSIAKRKKAHRIPIISSTNAHEAMAAADTVLVASGTATLEAALLKRPMVIVYKLSRLSAFLASHLVKLPFIGLPNILASRFVVPELLQKDATVDNVTQALLNVHRDPVFRVTATHIFREIHLGLRQNTAKRAASAIIRIIAQHKLGEVTREEDNEEKIDASLRNMSRFS